VWQIEELRAFGRHLVVVDLISLKLSSFIEWFICVNKFIEIFVHLTWIFLLKHKSLAT